MNPRDTFEGRQLERAARRYAAGLERTNCSRRADLNAASQAENYRAGLEHNLIVARWVKDVTEAIATWTARGLEPRVLRSICSAVFGLEV